MKLQTKLILLMGGTASVITAVVLLVSLFHIHVTMCEIQESGHRYAVQLLQKKSRGNLVTFRDSIESIFSRVSTSEGLFTTPMKQLKPLILKRFEHSLWSNTVVLGILPAPGKPGEFFAFQRKQGMVHEISNSAEIPFLTSPEFLKFLDGSVHAPNARFLIDGRNCWIVSRSEQNGRRCFHAVLLDSGFLSGFRVENAPTGFILMDGSTIIMESFEGFQDPIPNSLRRALPSIARQLSPSENRSFSARIFHEPETDRDWYVVACCADFSFLSGRDLRIVRIYEYEKVLPELTRQIERKIENLFLLIILFSVLGLVGLIVPMLFFSHLIAKPITEAVGFANKLADGNFPDDFHPDTGGILELDTLSQAFDRMNSRLGVMISKLKKSHDRELEARQDAEASNHLTVDFLETMAEEMREPVNSVSAFIALLLSRIRKNGSIPSDDVIPPLQAVAAQTARLNRMLGTLRDLTDLDSKRKTPKIEEIDLFSVLHKVNDHFRIAASMGSAAFETRYGAELPRKIYTDPTQFARMLRLAVQSLLESAPDHSKLTFSATVEYSSLFFRLVGATHRLPREFLQYRQGIPLSRLTLPSEIISMTLAEHIARALGGRFDLSVPSDQDFQLAFVLPFDRILNRPPSGVSAPSFSRTSIAETTSDLTSLRLIARSNAPFQKKIRILVTEDDQSNSLLIDMILKDAPCTLQNVTNAAECLLKLQSDSFDILILDLHLRGFEPFAFLRELRALHTAANLRIIALTGDSSDGMLERLRTAGVDCCLAKPLGFSEMLDAVRSLSAKLPGDEPEP